MTGCRAQFNLAVRPLTPIVRLTFHGFFGPTADGRGESLDILVRVVAMENEPDPICSFRNNWEADRVHLEPCQLQVNGKVEVVFRLRPDWADLTDEWQSIPVILLEQGKAEETSIVSLVPDGILRDFLKKELHQVLDSVLSLACMSVTLLNIANDVKKNAGLEVHTACVLPAFINLYAARVEATIKFGGEVE